MSDRDDQPPFLREKVDRAVEQVHDGLRAARDQYDASLSDAVAQTDDDYLLARSNAHLEERAARRFARRFDPYTGRWEEGDVAPAAKVVTVAPINPRPVLGLYPTTMACRHCGYTHPYMSKSLDNGHGEVYCGIPVLWCEGDPIGPWPPEDFVPPQDGQQVMIFAPDGLRLAIVVGTTRP